MFQGWSALAGSSVHFDHGFIKHWWPQLASRFSHRHYDVSAVKLFCESLGMPRLPKAEAHRAREDILESIAHARECVRWLAVAAEIES
jgi:oligoribonuclease (3'-5' exoribonuclease)